MKYLEAKDAFVNALFFNDVPVCASSKAYAELLVQLDLAVPEVVDYFKQDANEANYTHAIASALIAGITSITWSYSSHHDALCSNAALCLQDFVANYDVVQMLNCSFENLSCLVDALKKCINDVNMKVISRTTAGKTIEFAVLNDVLKQLVAKIDSKLDAK